MAKVAFIQDVMVEIIGYMSMSAVLKSQGHQVDVFYCDALNKHSVLKHIQAFSPDVVGFSVLTPGVSLALDMAREIKTQTKALTVFGNIHALLRPELIEHPAVDIVCLWEGEEALAQLCQCLDKRLSYETIPGLWVKTPKGIAKNPLPATLVNLDALPFYDRALYDKYPFFRHSRYLRLSLGRGCPSSCAFCHNAFLRGHYGGGRYVRKMSPPRAIAEIRHQIAKRPKVDFIFFTDEVFWITRDWLREFLSLYIAHVRIPFSANFHFSPVEEDDIRLFAEARVNNLIVAVETGDERIRADLLNKHVKDEDIFRVTGWMKKYKIRYVSSAMFGLPGLTVEDHIRQLNFYRRLSPSYLWTVFFQPYPGLKLSETDAVRQALASRQDFSSTAHHELIIRGKDAHQLENLKKVYFLCVKFPWLATPLIALCRVRIPLLFDLLFLLHFAYYIFCYERISVVQFLIHVKVFGLNPALARVRGFFQK